MCPMHIPRLASDLLSLFSLTALGYTFTSTGHGLSFSKDGQVLFQATVTGCRIGQLLGGTLPVLHHPRLHMLLLLLPTHSPALA